MDNANHDTLDLNPNQMEALRILWDETGLKPGEIQERFSWPVNNATLRSCLRVLMAKGFVIRAKQGKAYCYQAVAPRKKLFRQTALRMATVFADGTAGGLVSAMLKAGVLNKDELKSLRKKMKKRA